MATGGSGDVLTGVIAAFLAQKIDPFKAACFGVFVHGFAGDLAAKEKGQVSLIASDIITNLPAAFQRFSIRN
jgi:NAD(P)H-hydrate epimerase